MSSPIFNLAVAIVGEEEILSHTPEDQAAETVVEFVRLAASVDLCVIFPEMGVMVAWNGRTTFNILSLAGEWMDMWMEDVSDRWPSDTERSVGLRRVRDYIIQKMQERWDMEEEDQDGDY